MVRPSKRGQRDEKRTHGFDLYSNPAYEYGYLKVIGVVENVRDKSEFSPTINLRVYDSSSKTLLAEETTWPAGQYLKEMNPGASAAFECIESVPGEPEHIRYEVKIEKYDFDVAYPK